MARKTVERYNLGYNIQLKQFYLYYELEGENTAHQILPSPGEFLALSDMFRNEGPISFDTEGQYFVTQPTPPGTGMRVYYDIFIHIKIKELQTILPETASVGADVDAVGKLR